MTNEELRNLVSRRMLAKINQRFPGGDGLTLAAVRSLFGELLDELELESLSVAIETVEPDAAAEALRRLAVAIDGEGEADEPPSLH